MDQQRTDIYNRVILLKKICKICGKEFETLKYGNKRIYCFDCSPSGSTKSITVIRHKIKIIAINQLGGKCIKCGINKPYLLDFHHRNPEEKDGEISDLAKGYDLTNFFNEVKKCDLLCANCHREFHYLNSTFGITYPEYLSQ